MALIHKISGNFLEDFEIGRVFRHKGGKTVTEGLFNVFTDFSMTTNPLSKNVEYARLHGYDGLLCPSGLVMNVVFSQTVTDVSENARANLEYIDMRYGAPLYIGDTVESETTVVGVTLSSKHNDRGVAHVATVGRKQDGSVVMAFERKVQVWKADPGSNIEEGKLDTVPRPDCEPWIPPYDTGRDYASRAYLTDDDTYFEDFSSGDVYEHSRGRLVTDEHIALTGQLDNTSQVHCNQTLIDHNPGKYIGGRLIVFGGIPFNLCLGISCPDVASNSPTDIVYPTGRHTGPVFAGDTVFASTEIRELREYPGREDLGVLATTLRGHKFRQPGKGEDGPQRTPVFELERELAVRRRSHYAL